MASLRGSGKRLPIKREDWDFSSCPVGELMECCLYEYARSSAQFLADYEQRKHLNAAAGNFAPLPHGFGLSMECPEYPTIPWLKIDPKIRRMRVRGFFNFADVGFAPAYPHQSPGFNPQTGEEVGIFEISWGCSANQIVADFKKWVKARHKTQQAKISDSGAIWPQRLQKSAKGMLNNLGAWRLRQQMSYTEALELTWEHLKEPLFKNQAAWIRAKRKAEKFLGIMHETR